MNTKLSTRGNVTITVQFTQFISFISPFPITYILSLYNQNTNLLLTTQKKKESYKHIHKYLMLSIRYFDCKGEQEKLD